MAVYSVLDVSKYNSLTDYTAAAKEIDGVIMRCGYRGYGSSGSLVTDSKLSDHYNGFNGKTKIGFYFFTQAITIAEAQAEAAYVYKLIKDYTCDFPVYIDTEYSNTSHNGRADSLSKSDRTQIIIAFCQAIRTYGYRSGVYASDNWYQTMLDTPTLVASNSVDSLWVAKYSSNPPTYMAAYDYDGWQYSSSESISGYSGNVDKSRFYKDVAGWEKKPSEKIDINTLTINIEYATTEYDGTTKEPSVVISGLTLGTDYEVSYNDNVNAGTGKVHITGIGVYTGNAYKEFTITPTSISGYQITISTESIFYNGSPRRPASIYIEGLNENVDYRIELYNNTNTGTATIVCDGIGNYKNTTQTTFEISKASLADGHASCSPYVYKYTGLAIRPVPNVYCGSLTLTVNRDFTCEYEDNINVGTATITCIGTGNYDGEITCNFQISILSLLDYADDVYLDTAPIVYDGTAKTPETYIEGLQMYVDYKVTYINNINAGTATIQYEGIGDYQDGFTKQFVIQRKPIDDYSFSLDQSYFKYTSKELYPKVLNNSDLTYQKDYKLVYTNNINPGTATVAVCGINNYTNNQSFKFIIDYRPMSECIAKYGTASTKTIFRIDGPFELYAEDVKLKEGVDYNILNKTKEDKGNFYLVTIDAKGCNGLTGEANYVFRVVDKEPDIPDGYYVDDGVYNFGDEDEHDESAVGNYEFYDLEDEEHFLHDESEVNTLSLTAEEEIDYSDAINHHDYDFDAMSGVRIAEYDEDDGSNIDDNGNEKGDIPIEDDDDGTYNFGELGIPDTETAVGDYDFGDLDEGIDPDTVVIDETDYDFNAFAAGEDTDKIIFEPGTAYEFENIPIYANHCSSIAAGTKTGIYYIYNGIVSDNRIRICATEDAVADPERMTGWVETVAIYTLGCFTVGEMMEVNGKVYKCKDGSGGYTEYNGKIMYIRTRDLSADYPYGLSTSPRSSVICYASKDVLKKSYDIDTPEEDESMTVVNGQLII